MKARLIGFSCASMALAADQITKAAVLGNMDALSLGVEVLPVLDLVYLRNPGISFGMLGGMPRWLLVLASLVIVGILLTWMWRTARPVVATALGLISGGAIGNIVDRVRLGAVTDFLDFHVGGYHWPAFNLADVAIVCGAALMLLDGVQAPGNVETRVGKEPS
ncbi:signal peptidase II [Pseudaminobacter sp. NGMCC 1.201702]|uniref:signal peptidase II n=1 Tax=Pseudaminobacter sp. NGMCC 1.201702 TaxID=3391825 RepID=UPI0039EEC513